MYTNTVKFKLLKDTGVMKGSILCVSTRYYHTSHSFEIRCRRCLFRDTACVPSTNVYMMIINNYGRQVR